MNRKLSRHRGRQRRTANRSLSARILWFEPLWILLLAPSLLFTELLWDPTVRPLLIMALFLFWPLRLKAGEPLLPDGMMRWSIGFLLLWLPVTIWVSPRDSLSWEVAGYLYWGMIFSVALYHWRPLQKEPKWLMLGMVFVGAVLALIGPEYLSVDPDKMLDLYQQAEFQQTTRTGVFTINPNILGAVLAMTFVLGSALFLQRNWLKRRWLALFLVVPLLIVGNGLILSQSRSSWLAVLIAIILLLWLAGWKWPAMLISGVIAVGLVLLLVIAAGTLFPVDNLMQSAADSLIRRMAIWRFSLEMLSRAPIAGIGLGVYEEAFAAQFPSLPLVGGRIAPPHAHNLWLQVALDLGVPGLIAWVVLFVSLGYKLYQSCSEKQSPRYPLCMGVGAAIVVMVIIGCFDNGLWGTKLSFIPWSILVVGHLATDSYSARKYGNGL